MARGCSFLHLPQNDATVTVEVEDSTHNKISYSAKLGNELGLTPCGYRVYHAEFKDSTEEEGEYPFIPVVWSILIFHGDFC